jgi:hypothetical protein
MTIEAPSNRESWAESLTSEQDPAVSDPSESLIVTGAAVAAGVLTNRMLKAAWRQSQGKEPPVNPAAIGITWPEALIWGASVGAAIGVSRVLARRATTSLLR